MADRPNGQMTRQQLLTLAYALEDQRDRALTALERARAAERRRIVDEVLANLARTWREQADQFEDVGLPARADGLRLATADMAGAIWDLTNSGVGVAPATAGRYRHIAHGGGGGDMTATRTIHVQLEADTSRIDRALNRTHRRAILLPGDAFELEMGRTIALLDQTAEAPDADGGES